MIKEFVPRLGVSCLLLLALPKASDELINYLQAPHIFSGVAAIASCIGACLPVLTMFKNSD